MDPDLNLNYRRVKVRSAELHRPAELHRLAGTTRADRKAKASRPSTLHVRVSGIGSIVRRVTAVIRPASRRRTSRSSAGRLTARTTGSATALKGRRHLIR